MGRAKARKRSTPAKSNLVEMGAPAPGALRWFLPGLPLAVAIAAVVYCARVFNAPKNFFIDADPGWHIRAGDWILAHGALPATDPFSWIETGHRWFAWEWLAEILMALLHRQLGLPGIVWLYLLVIGAATWFWFHLHWKLGGNFLLACGMVTLLVSSTQVHWLARPHLFSFILLPAALVWLESLRTQFTWKAAASGLAIGALWANLHGSFPLGIAFAGLYGLASWFADRPRARMYFLAAACLFAGTLLNPYGWNLHFHVIDYLVLRPELREGIEEWQRYDFSGHFSRLQVGAAFAVAAAGVLTAVVQRRLAHAMIMALVILTGLSSTRSVPVMALVALPLANAAFTDFLEKRRRLTGLLNTGAAFRRIDAEFRGTALVPVLAVLLLLWLRSDAVSARSGFPEDAYPVRAAAAVAGLPADARLFTSPTSGGYLIYALEAKRRIWLDSRSDYFGPQPYRDYGQVMAMRAGWETVWKQYGFTHALLEAGAPLLTALEQRGSKRLHADSHYVLLAVP
jgi:lipoprotein signal peptidase